MSSHRGRRTAHPTEETHPSRQCSENCPRTPLASSALLEALPQPSRHYRPHRQPAESLEAPLTISLQHPTEHPVTLLQPSLPRSAASGTKRCMNRWSSTCEPGPPAPAPAPAARRSASLKTSHWIQRRGEDAAVPVRVLRAGLCWSVNIEG